MDGDTTTTGGNTSNPVMTGTGGSFEFEFTNDRDEGNIIDRLVPESYRDKQWVKNLAGKPVDELFKKVDNLESLIGQRQSFNFPTPDAPPEQVSQFRKQLGVPEAPDKYGYTPPVDEANKQVWEELGKVRDLTAWQAEAHRLHLTPYQFQELVAAQEKKVVEQYLKEMQNSQLAQQQEEEEQRKEFDQLASAAFGADKERVLSNATRILMQYTPDHLKPYVARLPNESMIVLASWINAQFQQDSINTKGAHVGGNAPASETEIRERGRQLQSELKSLLDKGVQGPKIRDLENRIKENYALLSQLRK